mgnify:FL=1
MRRNWSYFILIFNVVFLYGMLLMRRSCMVSLIISDLRKTFFVSAKLLCPKGRSINKKALAGISIELNSGLYGLLGPMVRENPP